MTSQRRLVRDEVARFNQLRFRDTRVSFIVRGFEDVPGTVSRPQAAINPLVEEADFIMLIVGGQLGSPTTTTPPYRTGIEEELAVALDCLGSAAAPMRDVMTTFRAQSPKKMRKPSSELREVLAFKAAIESTKEMLHVGTFPSGRALREQVWAQLEDWAKELTPKEPSACPKLRSMLDGTNRPPMSDPPSDDPQALVEWAEAQAALGLNTAADTAFARATVDPRPDHLKRYAMFLQRTGRLSDAVALDEQALALCVGSNSVDQIELRASLLAHMAQLKRKLGQPRIAKRLLQEAVRTCRPHAAVMLPTMGYVLDQLGITASRSGELDTAAEAFREAHELRVSANDTRGRAQSLINLARVSRARGDVADAAALLGEAVALLEPTGDTRELANALASLGDAVAVGDPEQANRLLVRALQINELLDNADGISVASNGLARLALARGDSAEAARHAQRVLELSSDSGNREGTAIAYRLRGEVVLAQGSAPEAAADFERSLEIARSQRDPTREAQAWSGLARSFALLSDTSAAADAIRHGRSAAGRSSDATLVNEFDALAEAGSLDGN
jgi:tetratricopeptide (TPR) repeat protein